jgi:signal transduction histidine kinase
LKAEWQLPTLSEILAQERQPGTYSLDSCWVATTETRWQKNARFTQHREQSAEAQGRAERQWTGAIAALEHLLTQTMLPKTSISPLSSHPDLQGLVLACPLPIFSHPELLVHLQTWNFIPAGTGAPIQLSPVEGTQPNYSDDFSHALPLLKDDPIAQEKFCLVLTAHFSLVMVLGSDLDQIPIFQFSFDPVVVFQAWQVLRLRLHQTAPQQSTELSALVQEFTPSEPDYKLVTQFSRLLLKYLPEAKQTRESSLPPHGPVRRQSELEKPKRSIREKALSPSAHLTPPLAQDVELLQAIAHTVRTPLATIRTLTRLLLKQKSLPSEIGRYLEKIDRECTEQIDRFNLIFQAAELETSRAHAPSMALTSTSVGELLKQSISRWQAQANQRNQTLQVQMPAQMPTVVSNPNMLDQALTGLIEQFTRGLPAGSHIQIQVMLAGNQLKLQLQSLAERPDAGTMQKPIFKAIGQLLMLQPETGTLSLNLSVTKNLFQALGGKLTVRQRPQDGEILTVYLPLGTAK